MNFHTPGTGEAVFVSDSMENLILLKKLTIRRPNISPPKVMPFRHLSRAISKEFSGKIQKKMCVQHAITRFSFIRIRMSNRTPPNFGSLSFKVTCGKFHSSRILEHDSNTYKTIHSIKQNNACQLQDVDHTKSISVPAAQRMCMMRYRLGGLVDHPRAVFSPSA